jgi:hypothetical protein
MASGRSRRRFVGLVVATLFVCARSTAIPHAQGGAPAIASVTLTPDRIAAGETTVLAIELDRPAPDGFVVGIAQITNSGVTDTVVNMPVSVRFEAGARRFPIVIRTQRKTDRVTTIEFTAFHGSDKRSAQLTVN